MILNISRSIFQPRFHAIQETDKRIFSIYAVVALTVQHCVYSITFPVDVGQQSDPNADNLRGTRVNHGKADTDWHVHD